MMFIKASHFCQLYLGLFVWVLDVWFVSRDVKIHLACDAIHDFDFTIWFIQDLFLQSDLRQFRNELPFYNFLNAANFLVKEINAILKQRRSE